MIQPAALPIFVPGSAMSEAPDENPGPNFGAIPQKPAVPAQFAGILAMQPSLTAHTAQVSASVNLPITAAEPANPTASILATALPPTGNLLPPALPLAGPVATASIGLPIAAKGTAEPAVDAPPGSPAAQMAASVRVKQALRSIRPSSEKPAESTKATATQGKPDATPESETPLPEGQTMAMLVGAIPGQPVSDESDAQPELASSGSKQRAASATRAAPQTAAAPNAPVIANADALPFIPAAIAPQVPAAVMPAMPDQPAERAKAAAAAPELTLIDSPQPMAGAASRLHLAAGLLQVGDKHVASSALPASEHVTPSTPQLTTAPLTSDQAITAPTAAPAEPRHDFSLLVDRLVAAREAAMPHPVHASLTHAEFGQVQLTFAHAAAGLTVAMASNDPDFARAVTAATPAEHKSGAGDAQNQTQGQTQSGAQQNGSDGRGGRPSVCQTAAANASSNPAAPLPGRAGIFA